VYSIDYSIPNEIDLVAVPEPATWFAAVLVTGSVAWSQRRRLARSFSRFWASVSRIPSGQLSIPRWQFCLAAQDCSL